MLSYYACFLRKETFLRVAAAVSIAVTAGESVAQSTTLSEQPKAIKSPRAVTTLGPDLFGDSVNLYQGGLTFRQTDVSLVGNSSLPVQVGRVLPAGKVPHLSAKLPFGIWYLDIPYMYGDFSKADGWQVMTGDRNARCSSFDEPPVAGYQGDFWQSSEFWHGNYLSVPGHGEQLLLRRDAAYTAAPGALEDFPVVTGQKWAVSCLDKLANESVTDHRVGEGFLAISPDGVRYRFDHMISYPLVSLSKPRFGQQYSTTQVEGLSTDDSTTEVGLENMSVNANLPRKEVRLLPTLVTDRFDNWVKYEYDPARPENLRTISTNDGRKLTLSYELADRPWLITSVSDGDRTWKYTYAEGTGNLTHVILPDNSTWDFTNLYSLVRNVTPNKTTTCDGKNYTEGEQISGEMVHPAGAIGTFTMSKTTHGRSLVPQTCSIGINGGVYAGIPKYFTVFSLASKRISGPGLPDMDLTYEYGADNASWDTCTSCDTNKTVTVTNPEGVQTRYTFGNQYRVSEGRIEQLDDGWDGSAALRSTTYTYEAPGAGPYPSVYGYGGGIPGDGEVLSRAARGYYQAM